MNAAEVLKALRDEYEALKDGAMPVVEDPEIYKSAADLIETQAARIAELESEAKPTTCIERLHEENRALQRDAALGELEENGRNNLLVVLRQRNKAYDHIAELETQAACSHNSSWRTYDTYPSISECQSCGYVWGAE